MSGKKSSPGFSLLLKRKFLPLFATQFLIAFNDNLFRYALIALVTFKLTSDQLPADAKILASIAGALLVAPFILFSSISGQLADKYERSKLMRYAKMAELCVMMAASFAFYHSNIYMLMGLLFAAGTVATFFSPMKYSVLPTHLNKTELVLGNGLIEGGTFLAILTGSIIGTTLGNFIDPDDANTNFYVIIAILSFSVIGIATSFFIPKAPALSKNLEIKKNIFVAAYDIVAIVIRHPALKKAVFGTSWFWMCGMIFLSLFPSYVHEVIGGTPDLFSIFLATFSIGIAAGSVSCSKILKNQISPRITHLALYGVSLFTAIMVVLSHIPFQKTGNMLTVKEFFINIHGIPIFISMMLMSFCWGLYSVPLKAIIQTNALDSERSRVIAAENIVNSLFMVLGSLVIAASVKLGLGIVDIFTCIAIVNIFVAMITKKSWKGFV